MKKIFMILFFIINSSIAFTYTYEDYDIFIQGKNAYRNGNYEEAQSKFETLLKSRNLSSDKEINEIINSMGDKNDIN